MSYWGFRRKILPTENEIPTFTYESINSPVRGYVYSDVPSLEIHIPSKKRPMANARAVLDFGTNVLPEYGTMSSFSQAKTVSQLHPIDKWFYAFTGHTILPVTPRQFPLRFRKYHNASYSLDVAKQFKSLYEHPDKAAKAGIKIEISPNTRMGGTNSMSQHFKENFEEFFSKTPGSMVDFSRLTPEQITEWNETFGKQGYPLIDPKTKTMDYYIFKRIPKQP